MIVLVGAFWLTKPQSKKAAKPSKPGQPVIVTDAIENESNQRAEKLYLERKTE